MASHPGFPPFMSGAPTPPAPPAKPPIVEVTPSKLIKIGNEYYRATVIDESGHSKMLGELSQDKIDGLIEVVKEIVKKNSHFDEMQINAADYEIKKGGKVKAKGKHEEALAKKIETIFTSAAAARDPSVPGLPGESLHEDPAPAAGLAHPQPYTIVSQPLVQPPLEQNAEMPEQLHIFSHDQPAPMAPVDAAASEKQNIVPSKVYPEAKKTLREHISSKQPSSNDLKIFLECIEAEDAVKTSLKDKGTHVHLPMQEVRDGITLLQARYNLIKEENLPENVRGAVEVLYAASAAKQIEELSSLLILHGGDKNEHSFKEVVNKLRSVEDIPSPGLLKKIEVIQQGLQAEFSAILKEPILPEEKFNKIKTLVSTESYKLKKLIPNEQREIYKTLPLIDPSLNSAINQLKSDLKFLNEYAATDQVSLEEFFKVFNTPEQFILFYNYTLALRQFLENKKQTGITGEVTHFIEKLKSSFPNPSNDLERKILHRMTARIESAVKTQETLNVISSNSETGS